MIKAQILAAVREAKGDKDTDRIAGFKKPDMVEAAEELLADTGWLPQPLRTAPLAEEANEPEFVIVDDGDVTPDGTAVEDDEEAIALRVFVGRAEIGAAWSKRLNENRDYLSLKLDDPSFTQPIYANLFDDTVVEGGDARPAHGLHRQSRPRAPGKGLGRAQPAG